MAGIQLQLLVGIFKRNKVANFSIVNGLVQIRDPVRIVLGFDGIQQSGRQLSGENVTYRGRCVFTCGSVSLGAIFGPDNGHTK